MVAIHANLQFNDRSNRLVLTLYHRRPPPSEDYSINVAYLVEHFLYPNHAYLVEDLLRVELNDVRLLVSRCVRVNPKLI